jgi:EpsI family protein
MGGLAVAAAATAEALRPRHKLVLLKQGNLATALPNTFGKWTAEGSTGLVSPDQAGRLAKSLYSEIIERIYTNAETGVQVMLLAAYGDTQSDLLQLHRPESCYPAVGFNITSTVPANIPVSPRAAIPGRKVVAVAEERKENISYWTRIGEFLPQSAQEQRRVRLDNAMHGYVADGILFRCSALGKPGPAFATLDQFVPELLASVKPDKLPALVGTRLARQMA